jgi:hypothetical protein
VIVRSPIKIVAPPITTFLRGRSAAFCSRSAAYRSALWLKDARGGLLLGVDRRDRPIPVRHGPCPPASASSRRSFGRNSATFEPSRAACKATAGPIRYLLLGAEQDGEY